jgi:uncharacterized membrane protein
MNDRPVLKPKLTLADMILEAAGWALVVILVASAFYFYSKLPGIIPVHFNFTGQPDSFGKKHTILLLPVIGLVSFAVLTLLNQVPFKFNYPAKITPENAMKQYTLMTRMIRYLKFILCLVFSAVTILTYETAIGKANGLGIWFVPMTLALILLPLLYFILRTFKTTTVKKNTT